MVKIENTRFVFAHVDPSNLTRQIKVQRVDGSENPMHKSFYLDSVHCAMNVHSHQKTGTKMSNVPAIQSWLEKLPVTTDMIRVRVGGQTLHTVATLAIEGRSYTDKDSEFAPIWIPLEDLCDSIFDSLSENGFGEEHTKARLHAYRKGKPLKSKAITATTGRAATQSGTDRAIEKLTDGILQSCAEMRKTVAILSETLAHREERLSDAIDVAIDSRAAEVDADGYARILEMLADAGDEIQDDGATEDPLKLQAAQVLQSVAGMFTNSQEAKQKPSVENVREWVNNADFINEMMQDNAVQAGLYNAFMSYEENDTKNQKPEGENTQKEDTKAQTEKTD